MKRFQFCQSFVFIALGLLALTSPFYMSSVQNVLAEEKVYTCSMHPQVRLPDPGNCPICSMPLVPAQRSTGQRGSSGTIQLSDHALAMAAVETALVERKVLSHVVRAVGKIAYDETSLATITSRVDGYAERLFVNFTGVEVNKGDHLAEVYSPDLVVAQQELLVAAGGSRPELLTTTKVKLHRLGLTDGQISELLEKRKVTDLKKVPGMKGEGNAQEIISVPASAVLDSGSRKLVYVEKQKGTFESRDVTLGPKAGDQFPVLSGLSEGERVAVRGNFLLDSQAQISGLPSLFYPQGAASFSHQHGETVEQSKTGADQDSAPTMSGHKH